MDWSVLEMDWSEKEMERCGEEVNLYGFVLSKHRLVNNGWSSGEDYSLILPIGNKQIYSLFTMGIPVR